jgi:hypothetical protein
LPARPADGSVRKRPELTRLTLGAGCSGYRFQASALAPDAAAGAAAPAGAPVLAIAAAAMAARLASCLNRRGR